MIKKSKTFCVAPWFQIRNRNSMEKRVCCVIKSPADNNTVNLTPLEYLNSDPIIELKTQLSEGERPSVCSACWTDEDNGNRSLRQSLNSVLTESDDRNTWVDSYFKHKKDYTSDLILMADVTMGNTCNYECVMCNPGDSSLIYTDWIKRKDSIFVKERIEHTPDYFDIVKFDGFKNLKYKEYIDSVIKNNKHLKYLKLLGGEPLLDNNLIDMLANLDSKIKKNLKLTFVTNGSVDILSILNTIGTFKHVHISVSLEGVGRVQEFARYRSNWNTVSNNILNVLNHGIDITVHHSFQTTTVLGFVDLLNWCKQHSIKMSCGIVEDPDYLSIRALPDDLKNEVIELITQNRNLINDANNVADTELSYENLILKIKNIEFDPELHKKFFEYIDWYQVNKSIPKLETIFPELYKYRNT